MREVLPQHRDDLLEVAWGHQAERDDADFLYNVVDRPRPAGLPPDQEGRDHPHDGQRPEHNEHEGRRAVRVLRAVGAGRSRGRRISPGVARTRTRAESSVLRVGEPRLAQRPLPEPRVDRIHDAVNLLAAPPVIEQQGLPRFGDGQPRRAHSEQADRTR